MIKQLKTPLTEEMIQDLSVGDMVELSGEILCGRDAVLPRVIQGMESGTLSEREIPLKGAVIFHTAVSVAGLGPTSSNKLEIESSIEPLSRLGVKLHLGKGKLHPETIEALDRWHSVYAIIPPVTALLGARTSDQKVLAFEELGMEALYRITACRYPVIIAAAHGRSIYDDKAV